MKSIFIGTVQFSRLALEKLIEIGAAPLGVITKESSSFNADYASLAPVCARHGISRRFAADINSPDIVRWIRNKNPDVIFCFGWSSLIKNGILNIPEMGVIGFHPAALPENRGRHPLIWALALGLTKTASTFFFMDEGADSGDILSQMPISIAYDDNALTLYEKISQTRLGQLEEFVPLLKEGTFFIQPQDHSRANTWRKRGKADGMIDFRMSSRSVYNLVRALTRPYIGVHVEYKGHEIKIWKATEHDCANPNIEPGKVII